MSFAIQTKTVSGRKIHNITWKSEPVSKNIYIQIANWVRDVPDYSRLSPLKLQSLNRLVETINANSEKTQNSKDSKITISQAISIRNIVLKDKIIRNYSRMNAKIGKIAAAYDAGNGILALSSAYDFPPLNLLRGIFLHKGYPSSTIYNIFANKEDPKQLLQGRDLSEYYTAEWNDAESTFNQQKIAEIAAKNETLLVDKFLSLGIALKTQNDLVAEQTAKYGRAVLTPDLLFLDEVYINSVRTYWIDYKDYIGTNIKFLYESNIKQSAKYNAKWGPGALCYNKSFVSGVTIPYSQLLDARAVGLKFHEM